MNAYLFYCGSRTGIYYRPWGFVDSPALLINDFLVRLLHESPNGPLNPGGSLPVCLALSPSPCLSKELCIRIPYFIVCPDGKWVDVRLAAVQPAPEQQEPKTQRHEGKGRGARKFHFKARGQQTRRNNSRRRKFGENKKNKKYDSASSSQVQHQSQNFGGNSQWKRYQ